MVELPSQVSGLQHWTVSAGEVSLTNMQKAACEETHSSPLMIEWNNEFITSVANSPINFESNDRRICLLLHCKAIEARETTVDVFIIKIIC